MDFLTRNKHQNLELDVMIKGSRLLCALNRRPQWTLSESKSGIKGECAEKAVEIPVGAIRSLDVKRFLLWSHLTVNYKKGGEAYSIKVGFLNARKTKNLVSKIEASRVELLKNHLLASAKKVKSIQAQFQKFQDKSKYLRHSVIQDFVHRVMSEENRLVVRTVKHLANHHLAKRTNLDLKSLLGMCSQVEASCIPTSPIYKHHNRDFVASEVASENPILAKLSLEQKIAAVTLEDRNLLIASAGSGKSWTLVGKAGYIINKNIFQPNEIVALAFNAAAAKELNERFSRELKDPVNGRKIKVHTFHALGAGILRSVARKNNERIKVLGSSRKGEKGDDLRATSEKAMLKGIIENLKQDEKFRADWLFFLTLCRAPVPMDDAFQTYEDYQAYIDYQRKERSGGSPAKFHTMAGEIVRSSEELAIANWLWTHSIPYAYEKGFIPVPGGWDKFEPDFYYPSVGVWHEHFGLNAQGKAPAFFENPKRYEEQAKFKEDWFATHASKKWFSTKSADYRDGSLFDKLEKAFKAFGQPMVLRSDAEVLEKVKALRQFDEVDLIARILHIIRGNGRDEEFVRGCVEASPDHFRAESFSRIYWPIQQAYEQELDKNPKKMDFDDMIIKAAKAVENGSFESPYRLIMVDEFQDLSEGRARLVKALLAQHGDSVLFGVGDDWQAINGFAGSDLQLFLNFEKVFGRTWEGKLSETFRCAQGIANVSSMFVKENSAGQKTDKKVSSPKNPNTEGTVDLVAVYWDDNVQKTIRDGVRVLCQVAEEEGRTKSNPISVLILGRYNLENSAKAKYLNSDLLDELNGLHEGIIVEYLTVHKSKGLEADYVFCVGLNRTTGFSFPSTFENDPLVEMLMQGKDTFPYAEERRLFYVALTRARKKVTLIFDGRKPSSFVLELMNKKYEGLVQFNGDNKLPELCKRCGRGYIRIVSQESRCSRYNKDVRKGCAYIVKLHAAVKEAN